MRSTRGAARCHQAQRTTNGLVERPDKFMDSQVNVLVGFIAVAKQTWNL